MSGILPALSGPTADRLLLAALALAVAGLLLVISRRQPILLAAGYLGVMCFVPIWSGIAVGVYFQPQVLMGLLVLAVAVPRIRRLGGRLAAVDLLVVLLVVGCLAPLAVGTATLSSVVVAAVQYLGAYLVGRLLPSLVGWDRLLRLVLVVFSLLAVATLAENLTGTNPFLSFPGSPGLRALWDGIQIRGGVARAEGAFGHSIALGASLALALPLVLAAPVRAWVRVTAAAVMLGAVVVTYSRIGLVTAVLGVALSVLMARELTVRLRVLLVGAGAAVLAVTAPLLSRVFLAAGDEATNSAAYRADLLALVGEIDALGFSSSFSRGPDGSVRFDSFGSIDSALILHGLTYGWMPLLVVLVLLGAAVVAVALRRAAAPTIAIAAQVPALATVALITQYATLVWFVGGLAVWAQLARPPRPAEEPGDGWPGVPTTDDVPSDQRVGRIPSSLRRPLDTRVAGGRV
ncbi:hypothetical protein QOZ88_17220 [Blastococcus sp. BMG 814]|uniref:O-antigen ligase like membrane protein n=1 Tax=Blastococcus carthaginiensis TaxID=3050034 RepID=A0ABT9IFN7_9ACTN|nr:hypothetical protein [Blastococcus carthaginiensis]MDP5184378.1 hypothetical protein [Blastococcus carthaginiensis]